MAGLGLGLGLGLTRRRRHAAGSDPLAISGTPVLTGAQGSAYAGFTVSASGGTEPYNFSVASGALPAGIALDDETGAIAGTPTEGGIFADIVIRVTDAADATDDLDAFTIDVSDPHFASVVLLMGFEGADGSTTFEDESNSAKSVSTVGGNAQIDTAVALFGTSSLLLDGVGDGVHFLDSPDWSFGSGDFTVECSVRWSTLPTGMQAMVAQWLPSLNESWEFRVNGSVNPKQIEFVTAVSGSNAVTGAGDITLVQNTRHHLAVSRSSGTLRLFFDGALVDEVAFASALDNSSAALLIGHSNGGSDTRFLAGWMDELRITKGVGRYTAAFTPPTVAFPRH